MKIENILMCLDMNERETLLAHLVGGTPSRTLADILTRNGYSVGKSTINDWRKANNV